jgi:hypothetical protein
MRLCVCASEEEKTVDAVNGAAPHTDQHTSACLISHVKLQVNWPYIALVTRGRERKAHVQQAFLCSDWYLLF